MVATKKVSTIQLNRNEQNDRRLRDETNENTLYLTSLNRYRQLNTNKKIMTAEINWSAWKGTDDHAMIHAVRKWISLKIILWKKTGFLLIVAIESIEVWVECPCSMCTQCNFWHKSTGKIHETWCQTLDLLDKLITYI